MGKTLIQGAFVLTQDEGLGSLPRGDVLIDGDRIAAVGVGLSAEGAEVIDGEARIVLPGFADTHRHMWAAMLRGCACYGDLGTYFHDVVFTYGANFTPDDTYTSIRLGLAEAIDSGITTLHAWEHNLQTREHAEAAITALEESGLRGRFSYGPSSDPEAGSSFAQGTETIDLDHVLELATSTVVATHSCARALRDHHRNLSDEHLRAIAATGGVIGMNVLPTFVDETEPTLDRVVDHIEHMVEVAGIDHVGLGPDFLREYMDAVYPQYDELRRFGGVDLKAVVPGLARERDLPNLTERLLERGWAEADVRKVLGENWLRVFRTLA